MRQLGKGKGFSGCDNLERIKDFTEAITRRR
jgi:hypothetical protein